MVFHGLGSLFPGRSRETEVIRRAMCPSVEGKDQKSQEDVRCNKLADGVLSQRYPRGKFSRRRTVQEIDFECSAHGPRGFDLANFFCEFAGFECDYSLLPDKATREVFYEIYLSDGDTVEQLEKEVEVFYIATHLFWGIWSVLQSKFSPIQFDFLDYARMRLRQFSVLLGENADSMSPSKQDSPLATPKSPNAPSSWGTVNEAHFTKSPRHSLDKNNTR